jgi:DNA-binding XRE family transcriptional regulator
MRTKRRLKDFLDKKLGPFTFGRFVRGTRANMDLTQIEMAKFIGISKSSLCDIEKGRQFVSPAFAAQFAKKCGYPQVVAVQACLNDQVRRAGLNLTIHVKAS